MKAKLLLIPFLFLSVVLFSSCFIKKWFKHDDDGKTLKPIIHKSSGEHFNDHRGIYPELTKKYERQERRKERHHAKHKDDETDTKEQLAKKGGGIHKGGRNGSAPDTARGTIDTTALMGIVPHNIPAPPAPPKDTSTAPKSYFDMPSGQVTDTTNQNTAPSGPVYDAYGNLIKDPNQQNSSDSFNDAATGDKPKKTGTKPKKKPVKKKKPPVTQ